MEKDRRLSTYEVFIESEIYIRRSTLYVQVDYVLGKLEIKRVPHAHISDLKELRKFILENFTFVDIKSVISTWDQNMYKIRFWKKLQELRWDRGGLPPDYWRDDITQPLG